MKHKIVNGLHCITNKKGHISVYTQEEYKKLKNGIKKIK